MPDNKDCLIFDSIRNLVVLSMETEDRKESLRHMARAMIIAASANLSEKERSCLKMYLLTEVIKDIF